MPAAVALRRAVAIKEQRGLDGFIGVSQIVANGKFEGSQFGWQVTEGGLAEFSWPVFSCLISTDTVRRPKPTFGVQVSF
jgi:hypothetical protein